MAGSNPYQEEVATDHNPKPVPGPNAGGTRSPSDHADNDQDEEEDTVEDPNANGDEGGVS